jgi:hypothetical protein
MPDQISVVYKGNVIIIDPDGKTKAIGSEWKHCPREYSDRPCPRHGREPMPEHCDDKNPKCRRCSYAATAHFKDQEQGLAVALLIYPEGIIVR